MNARSVPLRHAIGIIACATATSVADAQCPSGAPRVNGRCGDRPAARTLDPNRVAVLPFNTTSLDPSLAPLGKGLAELLSGEFNGEVGPAAVESGETYRAWDRAGGSRQAMTQATARAIAREVAAGQALLGSMVGTAKRFTVTASILGVVDGAVRISRVQVDGTEDSLSAVTSALATQLLGKSVGITGNVSNEAARAYIDGMALYRSRKAHPQCAVNCEAMDHFLRAATLDSTFVLPTYRLVLLRALNGPTAGVAPFRASYTYLWKNQKLLGADQRVLFDALADSNDLVFRAQALPRLERAMPALPASAEAWDILGDLYFHVGALVGREKWEDLSRSAFQKAVGLDATLCQCALEHLAHFAYFANDAKTYAKYAPATPWQNYLGAVLKGDRAGIQAARTIYARELAVNGLDGSTPEWLNGVPLPSREVDSLLALTDGLANTPTQRRWLATLASTANHFAGRPTRAIEAARGAPQDPVARHVVALERADNDSAASEQLFALLDKSSRDYGERACNVGLARLRRGDTTGVGAILAGLNPADQGLDDILRSLPPRGMALAPICAHVLRGVHSALQPAGGALLLRADSLMRYMPRNCCDMWNYDVALAFARRGENAMAASAVRRHASAIGRWPTLGRMVVSLRLEGRWAAAAGDTAAAVKAYQRYLIYRDNPEPSLVPQRDSVRSELAALTKAPRRTRS